jgi:small subunit ribosomal protein S17
MSNLENRKILTGNVIGNSMDKTVTVLIEQLIEHPFYHRVIKRNRKFLAHDEKNECRIGDKVDIMETRPLSKRKRWRVVGIVGKEK